MSQIVHVNAVAKCLISKRERVNVHERSGVNVHKNGRERSRPKSLNFQGKRRFFGYLLRPDA